MKCRRCKQIVLEAVTESGRKVTLDPDPARGGTMTIYYDTPRCRGHYLAEVVPPSRLKQYPGELYRVHVCKGKRCRKG